VSRVDKCIPGSWNKGLSLLAAKLKWRRMVDKK
jgi:hypothetical protein